MVCFPYAQPVISDRSRHGDNGVGGGGGARSSRALDKAGGLGLQKNIFWPFLPQFGLRMSGGASPGSTTGNAALTKR